MRLIHRWLTGEVVNNTVGIKLTGGPFDGETKIVQLGPDGFHPHGFVLAAAGDRDLGTPSPGTSQPPESPTLPPAGPTNTPEPTPSRTRLTLPPRAPQTPTRLDQRDRAPALQQRRAPTAQRLDLPRLLGPRPLLGTPRLLLIDLQLPVRPLI